MDTKSLAEIATNVQSIGNLIASPTITADDLDRLAKALHIAAQTLLIIAAKP